MNKSTSVQQVCSIVLSGIFPRRFSPLVAVWGGQTERETAFLNVKLHAARFRVCVGLAARTGVLLGVGRKPFLQGSVMGADMDKRVFLVKPNIGGLFLLGKPCSHKLWNSQENRTPTVPDYATETEQYSDPNRLMSGK